MASLARTTLSLDPKAHRIASNRAKARKISLGKAVSELIEQAAANAPMTRMEIRDGLPVLVSPPGSPIITSEMVKEILDNEW